MRRKPLEKHSVYSVKINDIVYDRLKSLVTDVNKKGWEHLGLTRADRATMSTVIEVALNRLGVR